MQSFLFLGIIFSVVFVLAQIFTEDTFKIFETIQRYRQVVVETSVSCN